jgi:hypothetical protein
MEQPEPMTETSVGNLLREAGAKVMSRSGRSESYGAPRDFSFEVRGVFANGMALHIVARQFNYRDPWEATGRVNDMVDVSLLKDGQYTPLPKGFAWFQQRDGEEQVDMATLTEMVTAIAALNPKIYILQKLTGDLP